jgi:hypothetical protein
LNDFVQILYMTFSDRYYAIHQISDQSIQKMLL